MLDPSSVMWGCNELHWVNCTEEASHVFLQYWIVGNASRCVPHQP